MNEVKSKTQDQEVYWVDEIEWFDRYFNEKRSNLYGEGKVLNGMLLANYNSAAKL